MSGFASPALIEKTALALLVVTLAVAADGPAHAAGEATALKLLDRPVTSDTLLKSMIGKWQGAGIVRQGSKSQDETLRCRTINVWAAGKKLMKMTLLCIGVDYRFQAVGFLGRSGSQYRGDWDTTFGRSATVAGKRRGTGLVLTLTPKTAKTSASTLQISLAGKQMTNTLTRRDRDTGNTYTAFSATLQK